MTADVKNPSFEIAGPGWGQAQDWIEEQTGVAEDVATFVDGGRRVPFERYCAGWGSNQLAQVAFGVGDLVVAMFENNSEPQETYCTSWVEPQTLVDPLNPRYNHDAQSQFGVSDLVEAMFNALTDDYEGYQEGWEDNEDSSYMFPGGVLWSKFTEALSLSILMGETVVVEIDGGAPAVLVFTRDLNGAVDIALDLTTLLGAAGFGVAPDDDHLGLQSATDETGTVKVTGGTARLGFPLDADIGVSTPATFTFGIPRDWEHYSTDWENNEDAEDGFPPLGAGVLSAAMFDGAAKSYENYGGAWTETLP
jgi:hypothetical protein